MAAEKLTDAADAILAGCLRADRLVFDLARGLSSAQSTEVTTYLHNLFLAVRTDAATTAHVLQLRSELSHECRLVGREVHRDCLHISLRSLGEYDEGPSALVNRTAVALAKVTMPPFVVAFNKVVGWKGREGRQPLVLTGDDGLIGIDMLLDQVNSCLAQAGIRAPRKSLRIPHATLLYGDVVGLERIIEPVKWRVRAFVLIDSYVGEKRHVVLFHQTLGGGRSSTVVR